MAIVSVNQRYSAVDSTPGISVSLALSSPTAIAKYNTLVLKMAMDNAHSTGAAHHVEVVDPAGNTWTVSTTVRDPGATNAGVFTALAYALVVNTYLVGATLTVNFFETSGGAALSVPIVCAQIQEYSGVQRINPIGGTSSPTGVGTTPSAALSVDTVGELLVGVIGIEGPTADAFTNDNDNDGGTSWSGFARIGTNTATATDNITLANQHKICTATSALVTWDPILGVSRDWAMKMQAFLPQGDTEGSFTAPLPAITSSDTAQVVVESAYALQLPGPITGAFTGAAAFITGDLACVLPALQVALTGQQPGAIGAAFTAQLPALEAFLIGQRPGASFLEVTLPGIEALIEMERQGTDGTVDVRHRRPVLNSHLFPVRWPYR